MAYWLFKSEPASFSWQMLKEAGSAGTEWTGVRNYGARNHMREMKVGDLGFFYHSNEGKDVVGIVEVSAPAHRDSSTDDARWECVDIRAVRDLPNPRTLDEIKANPKLSAMVLVVNSRLSVQPVTREEWREVCRMGGLDPAP